MSDEIKLEELDLGHEENVTFISATIKKYYPRYPLPSDPAEIRSSRATYFKAFRGSNLFGITAYVRKTPFLCETVKTVVFEEFKGQGLGKKLSQAIEDECIKRGFKKIMTSIYDFNIAMISIKLKQGYVIEGYLRNHDKPGLHEYTLGKEIK